MLHKNIYQEQNIKPRERENEYIYIPEIGAFSSTDEATSKILKSLQKASKSSHKNYINYTKYTIKTNDILTIKEKITRAVIESKYNINVKNFAVLKFYSSKHWSNINKNINNLAIPLKEVENNVNVIEVQLFALKTPHVKVNEIDEITIITNKLIHIIHYYFNQNFTDIKNNTTIENIKNMHYPSDNSSINAKSYKRSLTHILKLIESEGFNNFKALKAYEFIEKFTIVKDLETLSKNNIAYVFSENEDIDTTLVGDASIIEKIIDHPVYNKNYNLIIDMIIRENGASANLNNLYKTFNLINNSGFNSSKKVISHSISSSLLLLIEFKKIKINEALELLNQLILNGVIYKVEYLEDFLMSYDITLPYEWNFELYSELIINKRPIIFIDEFSSFSNTYNITSEALKNKYKMNKNFKNNCRKSNLIKNKYIHNGIQRKGVH